MTDDTLKIWLEAVPQILIALGTFASIVLGVWNRMGQKEIHKMVNSSATKQENVIADLHAMQERTAKETIERVDALQAALVASARQEMPPPIPDRRKE